MSKVFFGGSRKLGRLNEVLRTRLKNIIENSHMVLVGDANGADKAIQSYFFENGYQNVTVYCMDGGCRNNLGGWRVEVIPSGGRKKDFKYFAMKDERMSVDSDYGFMLWDGKSKGTLNNALNLLTQGKSVLVYFSPLRQFFALKSTDDVESILSHCDVEARSALEKTIKVSERSNSRQSNLGFA